jgi:hypothetical protein
MDPAMKQFMMNMVKARIMGDPKLRNVLQGALFARNPSKQTGLNLLKSGLMSSPNARKYLPLLGLMANPSSAGGMFKGIAQKAGIGKLFEKFGPAASLLFNQGGAFGLGTGGPLGQGVLPGLAANPLGTVSKMKFLGANPLVGLAGLLMNKLSPRIEGQTGALGQGFGPQMANLASKMFGTRTHEQAMKDFGPGIFGGTMGPRMKNFFGNLFGSGGGGGGGKSRIEEIDMSEIPVKKKISDGASPRDRRDFYDPFSASGSAPPPLLSGMAGMELPSGSLRGRFLPSVHQLMAAEGISAPSFFGDENYDVSG